MNSIKTIKLISLIIILLACSNRSSDKNITLKNMVENNYFQPCFQHYLYCLYNYFIYKKQKNSDVTISCFSYPFISIGV
jgi:hypothetical protein